jgi:hypothetical protein
MSHERGYRYWIETDPKWKPLDYAVLGNLPRPPPKPDPVDRCLEIDVHCPLADYDFPCFGGTEKCIRLFG